MQCQPTEAEEDKVFWEIFDEFKDLSIQRLIAQ